MLSKKDKTQLRSDLFRHLDGIATAPTAYALYEKGLLDYLLAEKEATLAALSKKFEANEGYLNVALRILCSQGWLKQQLDNVSDAITYRVNERSEAAFGLVPLYADVVHLLKYSEKFDKRKFQIEPFRVLEKIFKNYRKNYGIEWSEDEMLRSVQQQVLKHIEGNIIGPTTVFLGMGGMFHKYFMEASFRPEEYHKDPDSFDKILDFFSFLDWFKPNNGTYRFTEKGLFFAKRASAYGVTVSYMPTFRKVDELIFGNPAILREVPEGSPELHVDREMNVWGSGGAHSTYFKKIDEIVIDLFNKPIDEQPLGILDMGCGNGAFLQHLFEVIEKYTTRGTMLDEHPLFLVGADFNEAALRVTRANLIKADIWAKVIWGDIGRPDLLAQTLQEDYGIALGDLLNVRTFLDHNRIWETPKVRSADRVSESTGAFAHRGVRIDNNAVEDNLLEHFEKWAPYVKKFGLLVIELHTIAPELTAQQIGKTAATAYDATHGFSDQYIVEVEVFNKIASEAGLFPVPQYFKKYPNSPMATVSINLLKGKKEE